LFQQTGLGRGDLAVALGAPNAQAIRTWKQCGYVTKEGVGQRLASIFGMEDSAAATFVHLFEQKLGFFRRPEHLLQEGRAGNLSRYQVLSALLQATRVPSASLFKELKLTRDAVVGVDAHVPKGMRAALPKLGARLHQQYPTLDVPTFVRDAQLLFSGPADDRPGSYEILRQAEIRRAAELAAGLLEREPGVRLSRLVESARRRAARLVLGGYRYSGHRH
jgi:hypothetical protein